MTVVYHIRSANRLTMPSDARNGHLLKGRTVTNLQFIPLDDLGDDAERIVDRLLQVAAEEDDDQEGDQ